MLKFEAGKLRLPGRVTCPSILQHGMAWHGTKQSITGHRSHYRKSLQTNRLLAPNLFHLSLLLFLYFFSFFFFTSRRLPCLPGRARLSLVGVIWAVKLHRPQVEHHRFLDVVHHRQTVTIAKHNTGGGRGIQSQDWIQEDQQQKEKKMTWRKRFERFETWIRSVGE